MNVYSVSSVSPFKAVQNLLQVDQSNDSPPRTPSSLFAGRSPAERAQILNPVAEKPQKATMSSLPLTMTQAGQLESTPLRVPRSAERASDFVQTVPSNSNGFSFGNFLFVRTLPGFLYTLFSGGNIITGAADAAPVSKIESLLKDFDAKPLKNDPEKYKMFMTALDTSVQKTRKALDVLEGKMNRPWVDGSANKMQEIFNRDILQPGNLAVLRKNFIMVLDTLNQVKANGGQDIYIGDLGRRDETRGMIAFTSGQLGRGGYGPIVIDNAYAIVNVKNFEQLPRTIVHEAAHQGFSARDYWYGSKNDGNTSQALNNADSISYGIEYLSSMEIPKTRIHEL